MAASVELLKAARAKIADPANWTQEKAARDARGRKVRCHDAAAVCWCGYGALWSLTDERVGSMAERFLEDACEELFPGRSLIRVNDKLGHASVIVVYDLAIAKAEAGNA